MQGTFICQLTSSQKLNAGISNEAGRFSHDVQRRQLEQLKPGSLCDASGTLRPNDFLLQPAMVSTHPYLCTERSRQGLVCFSPLRSHSAHLL
jgi:hypothetical protein